MKTKLNDVEKEIQRLLFSDISNQLKKANEKRECAIAYAYLWMAISSNITFEEAFRKYGWYEIKNIHEPYNLEQYKYESYGKFDYGSYYVTLVPRENPLDYKAPYREACLKLLDFMKEKLGVGVI